MSAEQENTPLTSEQELETELPTPPVIDEEEPEAVEEEATFGIKAVATLTADQSKALKIHNDGRRAKGVAPLAWDESLETEARKWANHLATNVRSLQHSTGAQRPNQGENLYWASGGYKEPHAQATQGWMAEAKYYTGQKVGDPAKGVIGHYTQCMWSGTKKVGIAAATDSKGGVYVVARYSPPGNYVGKKPF